MSVVIILMLASLAVAALFLGAFVWSVRSGQYDDTLTPAMRILTDDGIAPKLSEGPAGPIAPPADSKLNPGAVQQPSKHE